MDNAKYYQKQCCRTGDIIDCMYSTSLSKAGAYITHNAAQQLDYFKHYYSLTP